MKEKNKKIETTLIVGSTLLFLVLVIFTLQQFVPDSFNTITGDVISRVNITQPLQQNCNFTLYEGLNLVSFFCIPNSLGRDYVIGSVANIEAVFEYQEGSSDLWKTYNPGLPSFVVQDLTVMSRTEGYWLKMYAQEAFFLEGGLRLPTDIPLQAGWNLAGYPTNEIKSVNDSFQSIGGNFTEVRAYNPITDSTINFVPGVGGALNQTEPYYGYWINATTSEVWTVD